MRVEIIARNGEQLTIDDASEIEEPWLDVSTGEDATARLDVDQAILVRELIDCWLRLTERRRPKNKR